MPPEARVGAALFGGLAAFQTALAAGAPWGAAAFGGANPGVLPAGLRVAAGASAVVWGTVAAGLVTARLTPRGRRRLVTALLPVMAVATALNAASPSGVERMLWTPFAVVQLVVLWRLRRRLRD